MDAKRFHGHFGSLKMKEREFVDLGWNQLAVKLESGEPYWSSVERFPEEQFARYGKEGSVIRRSLDRYGTPRSKVERKIRSWQKRWMAARQ